MKLKMSSRVVLLLFSFVWLFSVVSADITTDLLVYYQFDETSGLVATDQQGNQNGVIGSNVDINVAACGIGGTVGYNFTNIDYSSNNNQWVNITGLTSTTQDYTVSFWANSYNNTERVSFDTQTGRLLTYTSQGSNGMGYFDGSGVSLFSHYMSNNTLKHYVYTFNSSNNNGTLYENGIIINSDLNYNPKNIGGNVMIGAGYTGTNNHFGCMDEVRIYERTLSSSDVVELYNTLPSVTSITLLAPSNEAILTTSGDNFTATFNITEGNDKNWYNATYYVWKNDTLFNETTVTLSGNNTLNTLFIDSFTVDNYKWAVQGWYGNSTDNFTYVTENFTFDVGANLLSLTYNTATFETQNETFSATFSVLAGAEIALAQLIYGDNTYTINQINASGTNLTITRTIDIPLNSNPLANQTNQFYFRFTYEGSSVQETANYSQNSSFINLVECGAPYTTQALNYSLLDELNQTLINTTAHTVTFETNFEYWLGGGSVAKNYSFQELSTTNDDWQFCIYPNEDFSVNNDVSYSALNYAPNDYALRNASLDNESNDIILYLLNETQSEKFYVTVYQGVNPYRDALVLVDKYFVGLGQYKTVSSKVSDTDGQFEIYFDTDEKYRFTIIRDNAVQGQIEKTAACTTTPCELSLQIDTPQGNIFAALNENFASNVVSSLVYDKDTQIVTYTFVDTTGLANYFRLEVKEVLGNTTDGQTVCNKFSYTTSGTLTCNMTGFSGEFVAYTYISRSPEKIDAVISFLKDTFLEDFGIMGLLFSIGIILTFTLLVGAVSRGNPNAILFAFAISLIGTKIMNVLPFTWVTVSVICLGCVVVGRYVKT